MRAVFIFVIPLSLIILECAATKTLNTDMSSLTTDQTLEASMGSHASATSTTSADWDLEAHLGFSIKPEAIAAMQTETSDSLSQAVITYGEGHLSSQVIAPEPPGLPDYSESVSAVANKIVENYLNSKNKEPGGHCLHVSKKRFEKAYSDVYGHTVYEDLPDSMATTYYTPREVFDFLYVSATGIHEGWRGLPMEYRGKGSAGAIAYAGMGTLVDCLGIWRGELRPGAPMQVWKRRNDYEKVVRGINQNGFDPFGHSFIFMGYVRNERHDIIGIRIADQGYQSYRPLLPNDYEVWWAVNLSI